MSHKLCSNQLSFHELYVDSTTNSFRLTANPKILNIPEVGRGSFHVYCGDLQRDGLQLYKKKMRFISKERVVIVVVLYKKRVSKNGVSKERVVIAIQLGARGKWLPASR